MRSLGVGRVAGIRLELGWSWFALLPLVSVALYASIDVGDSQRIEAVAASLVGSALLLVSVVLHELAHVLVARRHGIGVARIAVFLLGGFSEMDLDEAPPRHERSVALAGPVGSAALGGAFAGVALLLPSGPLRYVLIVLVVVNLGVAMFNLLPAFPLDGGRVLRATLVLAGMRRETAESVAVWIGIGVGAATAVVGLVVSIAGGPAALVVTPIGVTVLVMAIASRRQPQEIETERI